MRALFTMKVALLRLSLVRSDVFMCGSIFDHAETVKKDIQTKGYVNAIRFIIIIMIIIIINEVSVS